MRWCGTRTTLMNHPMCVGRAPWARCLSSQARGKGGRLLPQLGTGTASTTYVAELVVADDVIKKKKQHHLHGQLSINLPLTPRCRKTCVPGKSCV